jgi:hypothetical protein
VGWCVRVHPLFHRWFQNVFNQGVARVDDARVGVQHLQQKGLKGRSVKKTQRILLWWPQKQNNRKKEKMSQHSKKKKISNNKMYRTKPFGISCTLHSVQRRSTNRDTALSHTTTWFVFAHVSHSSEAAWGKEKQNVFVRQNDQQKNNFQTPKIPKIPKLQNSKIFQPQKIHIKGVSPTRTHSPMPPTSPRTPPRLPAPCTWPTSISKTAFLFFAGPLILFFFHRTTRGGVGGWCGT